MRRHEIITKEDLLRMIDPNNQEPCEKKIDKNNKHRCTEFEYDCLKCIWSYLNEEVEVVPRIETIKNVSELERVKEFYRYNKASGNGQWFKVFNFLSELVLVEKE